MVEDKKGYKLLKIFFCMENLEGGGEICGPRFVTLLGNPGATYQTLPTFYTLHLLLTNILCVAGMT